MKTQKVFIQLYDYKGNIDCFGHKNTEDRYIIIDEKGFDLIGSNFTKEEAKAEAKELYRELNNLND